MQPGMYLILTEDVLGITRCKNCTYWEHTWYLPNNYYYVHGTYWVLNCFFFPRQVLYLVTTSIPLVQCLHTCMYLVYT